MAIGKSVMIPFWRGQSGSDKLHIVMRMYVCKSDTQLMPETFYIYTGN